jgi:hypothetical protein
MKFFGISFTRFSFTYHSNFAPLLYNSDVRIFHQLPRPAWLHISVLIHGAHARSNTIFTG